MNNALPPTKRPSVPVVLIVDDDPEWRDFLCTVLGDQYFLLVATEGRAALDIAVRMRPDAILLDVIMSPGLDGFSTLCELRKHDETKDAAVILLTGVNAVADADFNEAVLEQHLGTGPTAYLEKPVAPEVLLATVRSALQKVASN